MSTARPLSYRQRLSNYIAQSPARNNLTPAQRRRILQKNINRGGFGDLAPGYTPDDGPVLDDEGHPDE